MNRLVIISLLLGLSHLTNGQTCTSERYLSGIFQSSVNQDIVYGNAPAITTVYVAENVTVNQAMTMDIFYPVGDAIEKRPAVMLAYGGGFLVGSKEDEDVRATCDSLAKKGYVTASINYRMNMNIASSASAVRAIYRAAQDYNAAIRYLKEFSNTYGVDTNYIFVGGVSAGGFSAMHAVFMDESERPLDTYQSGLFGQTPDLGCITCEGNSYNHTTNVRGIINLWGAMLDDSYIQQDELVPMTLFHGTSDLIVPYDVGVPFTALFLMPEVYGSEPISNRVNSLGGTAELNTFAGVGHNIWGVNVNNQLSPGPTEHWSPITDSIISFLYENIRPTSPVISYNVPFCSGDTAWLQVTNVPEDGRVCWGVEQGTVVAANSDSSEIGVVWSSAGNHEVAAVNFNHLDAVSTTTTEQVSVYITPVVGISDLGGVLQASGNYDSYQWYLNGVAIPGEEQQQYAINSQGTYAVEAISANGCSARSEPLILVGIVEPFENAEVASIKIYDLAGRVIDEFSSLNELDAFQTDRKGLVIIQFFNYRQELVRAETRFF